MKIMFLHSGDKVPSSRFRVFPYIDYFRRDGHIVTLAGPIPQKYESLPWVGYRLSKIVAIIVRWFHLQLCRFGNYDVVVIDREIFDSPNDRWEARFRRFVPAMVIDVDDAIFLRYPQKFRELMKLSDLVIAGNRFLEKKIYEDNPHTIVIPTSVEMSSRSAHQTVVRNEGRIVIGWVGTTTNLMNLTIVAEALRNLAQRHDYELRIISGSDTPLKRIDLSGIHVKFIPWKPETSDAEISKFDVGFMPLIDDEWNQFKCGFKLLQYMSMTIPSVASPVGVNAEIVEHQVDGLLASTTEEWESAFHELIQNPDLRAKMGKNGRLKVESQYSIEVNYPLYEKALLELCQNKRNQQD